VHPVQRAVRPPSLEVPVHRLPGREIPGAASARILRPEFFPAAIEAFPDLFTRTALTVFAAAPSPTAAAQLTEADLRGLLDPVRRGLPHARVRELVDIFAAERLHQPAAVE
jgi:hypothetical protein